MHIIIGILAVAALLVFAPRVLAIAAVGCALMAAGLAIFIFWGPVPDGTNPGQCEEHWRIGCASAATAPTPTYAAAARGELPGYWPVMIEGADLKLGDLCAPTTAPFPKTCYRRTEASRQTAPASTTAEVAAAWNEQLRSERCNAWQWEDLAQLRAGIALNTTELAVRQACGF